MTPQKRTQGHRAQAIGLALLAVHVVFAIPLGTSMRAAFSHEDLAARLAITAAALAATIWLLRRRVVG